MDILGGIYMKLCVSCFFFLLFNQSKHYPLCSPINRFTFVQTLIYGRHDTHRNQPHYLSLKCVYVLLYGFLDFGTDSIDITEEADGAETGVTPRSSDKHRFPSCLQFHCF